MAAIKPRMKWVAELDNARLSFADIATILGHEIMAGKLGEETSIKWFGNVTEKEKTRILFSVLGGRGGWSLAYPKGKKTCYKFNAYDRYDDHDEYRNGERLYDYVFWANIDPERRNVVNCTLIKRGKVIASVDIDMDYFDYLGSLEFGGEDSEWNLVED